MKSVLLNTTVIGKSTKLPRHPKLIIGEVDEYNYGDILDANAVKKEIEYAVQHAETHTEAVQQQIEEIRDALYEDIDAKIAAAVASIIGGAPETLDTLKELADALNNNPAFASDKNIKDQEQDASINALQQDTWVDVA